jgi:methionyl-tRNA formyltransferase
MGLECIQPYDINSPEVLARLRSVQAHVLVVASFGQILKKELLDSLLCVNIHASLLPAYRGAAPIERALAAGEEQTGVTIMRITERLDAGPWALRISRSISLRDDAGSVRRALAFLGAQGVDQVLTGLEDGTVTWVEQEGESEYAEKLSWRDCLFDLAKPARAVHDQVRALSPEVGARAESGALRFKIWRTWPYGQAGLPAVPAAAAAVAGRPGEIALARTRLFVGCGQGVVELLSVQPEGRRKMSAGAFLRGYRSHLGARLSPAAEGLEVDASAG